jgi:hypothetical protein
MGRPEVYQDKIGAYICQELMKGRTLTKISKDKKMPSLPTIYGWLNKQHPNFKKDFFNSYVEARKVQAEVMADQTADISDEKGNIKRNALRVKTRQWIASKMHPTKFGDKVEVTGKDGGTLIPGRINLVIDFGDEK